MASPAARTFNEVTAHLTNSDKDLWLGQLVWYGVSKVLIQHTQLVQALVANNLTGFIPRLPSDVDVFRRVCTGSQRKRVPTSDPDTYENYLIRDIPMDAAGVYKLLVKETVSPGNLKYETQLCTISFRKSDSSLQVSCIGTDVVAQQIVHEIETRYAAEQGTLDSYAVRELIRKILLTVNAVNVRGNGGGVYFVAQEHQKVLEGLEGFAAAMPGQVLFHTLPLLDDGKQREMLRRAFESETLEEIERLIDEITALDKIGKPVTAEKVATLMRQMVLLKAKAGEYTALLESSSDTVRSALDIFQRLLLRLAALVPA